MTITDGQLKEIGPSHFSIKRVKSFVRSGSSVEGRTVRAVGRSWDSGCGDKLTPVRFEDAKCGIVSITEHEGPRGTYHTRTLWEPDYLPAKEAIESAKDIPTVTHGIGSDVYHVRGEDPEGQFLVKLYYNAKKDNGRVDELIRR